MKNTMMKGSLYGLVGGAALILAGCGGDSSDGGITKPNIPGAPIAITSSNQNQVVANTADGAEGTAKSSMALMAAGAMLEGSGNTDFSAFTFARGTLLDHLQQSMTNSPTLPAGVIIPIPCGAKTGGSGTMTVSTSVTLGQPMTTGDTASVNYDSCDDGQGTVINGAASLRVLSGSLCDTCGDFSASLSIDDLQVTEMGDSSIIDGGLTMTQQGSTGTFRGADLYIFSTTGGGIHLTDFIITSADNGSGTSETITMTLASTDLNGSVTVITDSPLVTNIGDDHPSSGVIVITGDQSGLRVTALSETSVQIELDANGDGNYDDGTATVLWTTIEQS